MNSTAGKRVPGAQVASEGGKTPAPVPKSDLHLSDSKPKSFKIKIAKDATSNAGSDQEGSVKGAKGSKTSKTTKKRKAEDTPGAKKAPSKSAKTTEKKDKNKKKVETKPKGPVNVEKQCGVPLPQGGLCARSLTCKSHSMGSKRAVTGRSQPYDILLAQYQKKNHAKLSMKAAQEQAIEDNDDGGAPIDSDEEVTAVMEAIARSTARTPSMKALMPVRRRHKFLRMREMMSTALRPGVQASQIQTHGKFIPFSAVRNNV